MLFGLSLTTLLIGVAVGLVLVQLYPPSARIGVWIIGKCNAGITWIRER